MNEEQKLFKNPPNRKGPVKLTPANKRPSLSGFIIIRLPPGAPIRGGDLRKREGTKRLPQLTRLLSQHPKVVTRPVVRSVKAEQLLKLEQEAKFSQFPPLQSLT